DLPWRIVATQDAAKLRAEKPAAHLFTDVHAERTLVVEAVRDWESELLRPLFEERAVCQLMLECGGAMLAEWLKAGLINEWVQIITPYIAGGPHELIAGADYLPQEVKLSQQVVTTLGADLVLRGVIE
ncbi:MAG: dihydrofolate reductase family protein, partial [Akkermansia sp.]